MIYSEPEHYMETQKSVLTSFICNVSYEVKKRCRLFVLVRMKLLLLNAFDLSEDSISAENITAWIHHLNITDPERFTAIASKIELCSLEAELDTVNHHSTFTAYFNSVCVLFCFCYVLWLYFYCFGLDFVLIYLYFCFYSVYTFDLFLDLFFFTLFAHTAENISFQIYF